MMRPKSIVDDSEPTLTPNLRFPEFRDWPGWKTRKLSCLLSEPKQRNRDLKYGANEVLSVSGEFGCVNQIEHLGRSYAGASVENYHVVENGDVVYTKSPLKRNPYGIIKANKGKSGIVSTLYAVYRPTAKGHAEFLDYYFSRDYRLNSYLRPLVRKGPKNDMKVNNSEVLTGDVVAPEIEEQQKIAECLKTLDELIRVESKKLAAFKAHKKGLLQQLLPTKGQNLPRLRFPEFRDAPAWEPVSIGDASVPVTERVGARQLTTVSISAGIGFVPQAEKFGRNISGNQYKLYTVVQEGDFVYNKGNSLKFPQGCVYELRGWSEVAAPNVFISFRLKEGFSRSFFQNCFEQNIHGLQLKRHITSGARSNGLLNISKDHFFAVKIPTPSPAEQQKVAECLCAMDELVAAQNDRLSALQSHKQGLLQQLFPSPADATT